jgi:hypothetical protein
VSADGSSDALRPILQRHLACRAVAEGLKPTVSSSFPNGSSATMRGSPVRVTVSTSFTMLPIVSVGTITLRATAEMRIEQDASRYLASDTYTPEPCP